MILDVLRALVDDYGATVVLSTATQPAFWALPVWSNFNAVSLLPDEAQVQSALRRVAYEWRLHPRPDWATVAGWMGAERQALAVVNTTADAQRLHRELSTVVGPNAQVLHLSTRMCGEHRRSTLDRVRSQLAAGDQVLLVSTQVIEAGVDVDFPVVFRALAPADSIAQAAGRANREGRLPGLGRVVVFDPAAGGSPGQEYKTATELTRQRFGELGIDPDEPVALAGYYQSLYASVLPAGRSPAGDEVQEARAELAFRRAAEKFRMIDDTSTPVIVDFDDPDCRASALAKELGAGRTLSSDDWRWLQSRTATLPHRTAKLAVASGLAVIVGPECNDGFHEGSILLWTGPYHPLRGVDPAAPATPEEVIW